MGEPTDLVTVFRSADEAAQDDARAIGELLTAQGLVPTLLDDSAPGVPEGAWEVQVPASQAEKAEALIAQAKLPDEDLIEADDSAKLDTVTVFSGGELETTAVASVLEDAGVATVTVGDSVLPNLAFEVRVAKEHAERAQQLIREAQAAGPAAAEEAELAGENQS